jgi:ribosomal protein L40E
MMDLPKTLIWARKCRKCGEILIDDSGVMNDHLLTKRECLIGVQWTSSVYEQVFETIKICKNCNLTLPTNVPISKKCPRCRGMKGFPKHYEEVENP